MNSVELLAHREHYIGKLIDTCERRTLGVRAAFASDRGELAYAAQQLGESAHALHLAVAKFGAA